MILNRFVLPVLALLLGGAGLASANASGAAAAFMTESKARAGILTTTAGLM
jgi:hypothetical protein